MDKKIKYIRICNKCRKQLDRMTEWSAFYTECECPQCGIVDIKDTKRVLVKKNE